MHRRYEIHTHHASLQMYYLPKEMQRRAARIKSDFIVTNSNNNHSLNRCQSLGLGRNCSLFRYFICKAEPIKYLNLLVIFSCHSVSSKGSVSVIVRTQREIQFLENIKMLLRITHKLCKYRIVSLIESVWLWKSSNEARKWNKES